MTYTEWWIVCPWCGSGLFGALLIGKEVSLALTSACLWSGLFVETVHPVFGSGSMEGRRTRRSLKRLDFVRAYSEYYWSKANNIVTAVYTNSRALVPSALNSSIRAVEDKVTEFGTPLLAAVQSRSEQVLTSLDSKVRRRGCCISIDLPRITCILELTSSGACRLCSVHRGCRML